MSDSNSHLLKVILKIVLAAGAGVAIGLGVLVFRDITSSNSARAILAPRQVDMAQEDVSLSTELSPSASGFMLLEFMDYGCPPCRAVEPELALLLDRAPGLGRRILHWPSPGHPHADEASLAVLAAQKYNLDVQMHKSLMTGDELHQDAVDLNVNAAGISQAQWSEVLEDAKKRRVLEDTDDLARKLKINATPTFLMRKPNGDTLLFGAFSQIEAELEKDGLLKLAD